MDSSQGSLFEHRFYILRNINFSIVLTRGTISLKWSKRGPGVVFLLTQALPTFWEGKFFCSWRFEFLVFLWVSKPGLSQAWAKVVEPISIVLNSLVMNSITRACDSYHFDVSFLITMMRLKTKNAFCFVEKNLLLRILANIIFYRHSHLHNVV